MMTDKATSDNYITADNLISRISIHSYATNPGWTSWLFDQEISRASPGTRILDIGCGTGELWFSNSERLDPSWEITLADSSPGMIDHARGRLGARFSWAVADIESLPFSEDSFDLVVANHMLYHVDDRPAAFQEVRKVLTADGRFCCSTNGNGHLAQLQALAPELIDISRYVGEFGLESGPPQLQDLFTNVQVRRFESVLEVPAVEPVLDYICSGERDEGEFDLNSIRDEVQREISRSGTFRIDTRSGVISCQPASDLSASEVSLTGGWSTSGVVRIGQTVRRPQGPNAGFVAGLLGHLESVGFDAAPCFLGYDDQGRETLTFIAGEVPSDCGAIVWSDDQLRASMHLLRDYHDATAESDLRGDAEVVCHNDYGPWNLVWREQLPIAIIDFVNAAPGNRLDDLGYAAWKHLNLGLVDLPASEQRRRLRVLADSYDVSVSQDLIWSIRDAQARMRLLIDAAEDSVGQRAALARISQEQEWLRENGCELVT